MNMIITPFSQLTPDNIFIAAESFTGHKFDGTLTPYNSYVNRVFGLTDESGKNFIIKFYRPGRWTAQSILDEHCFLQDCYESEIPVVTPLPAAGISESPVTAVAPTLAEIEGIYFSVFSRLSARTFDIYHDSDWIRTGSAVGRLHCAAEKHAAQNRLQCTPQQTTEPYIRMLLKNKLITPQLVPEFIQICDTALDYIEEGYESCFGLPDNSGIYHTPLFHRIHGDCHRGNILEQYHLSSPANSDMEENGIITFIDFDDMMTGPAIQDLWLLLPGYRKDSMHELNLLLEGYEEFAGKSIRSQIPLIEGLRFMRNIYFLAWTAIQYYDKGFADRNPGWGTKAFWETELEDMKTQLDVIISESRT
jgi:Ser/Thr protein kinase RdoA (MazF antagonist)